MSTYTKPHLSFVEQLQLLKSRGLIVTNDELAVEHLNRLGYYRLSGYLYPCRKLIDNPDITTGRLRAQRYDEFMPGAQFQDAVALYVFDKKLRLIVLDAIERIEVAIRVDVAYLLGEKDKFAYENSALLHRNFTMKTNAKTGNTKHRDWLQKHEQMIIRSNEDFAQHYKSKYGLPLPIWVAVELWDFGLLSMFYQGMTVSDKTAIAAKYNVLDWQVMESWLHCVNYVRNVAAHHSRLWNRNLIAQPKLAKKDVMPDFDSFIGCTEITSRVYIILCILSHFMKQICPRSTWPARVLDLIGSFPKTDYYDVLHMGFPADWESHIFWK